MVEEQIGMRPTKTYELGTDLRQNVFGVLNHTVCIPWETKMNQVW